MAKKIKVKMPKEPKSKKSRRAAKEKAAESRKMPANLLKAKFSAAAGGFGFATPMDAEAKKKYKDIFIPPQYVNGAIEGSIVNIVFLSKQENHSNMPGKVGRVVEIIDQTHNVFVAQLNGTRSARPLNKHLPEEVRVNQIPRNAQVGDWVKLRLLNTGSKHTEQLRTEAFETIGEAGTVKADLNAIVAEFGLQDAYTEADNLAAEKITPKEIDRKRMVRPWTVTIDPTDAHDFDDALSLQESTDKKQVYLGVHIADVAAFVPHGSAFDAEAKKRGFSAYLPGRFLPMLPARLTARISLRENVEGPAHTVLFTIDKATGKIVNAERFHSIVKVNKRLDYATVQAYLDDKKTAPKDWTAAFKKNLNLLVDIVHKLRENRRREEIFLDMPMPEIRAVCNEETGEVTSIERKMPCEADSLVEECMLAANSAVADELIRRGVPGLFRIHPEPDPDKIDNFIDNCVDQFHFSPGDILSSRTACANFLAKIPNDHRKPVVLSLFLRSLPRASYASEPGLHYGLGKVKYSHFTSPIRRYTDLTVHQQLWAIDTNASLRSAKKMYDIAELMSAIEENVDNAYFAANDNMKVLFLKQHNALENGTVYEAVITKISPIGLTCSIDELGIYGFIPKKLLRGGDFRKLSHGRQKMIANAGHTQFKIGDFIYVALDSIDVVHSNAVFRPVV